MLAGLPSAAAAAPPANDNFADAQELTSQNPLPIAIDSTTVDATAEPGEPQFETFEESRSPEHSVWYEWQPEADGRVRVDACGDERMRVAVYTGDEVDALVRVSTDEYYSYSQLQCRVTFTADDSETYKIAVDSGFGYETEFYLIVRELSPPANDDFANAEEVLPHPGLLDPHGLPIYVFGTTADATAEPGERDHLNTGREGYGAEHSVWYEWRPSASGPVTVDAGCGPPGYGGSLPGVVVVYSGNQLNALNWVAGNYPEGLWEDGPEICLDSFYAEADQTYRIAVDWYGEHPFQLTLREPDAPANDNFAKAEIVRQSGPRIPLSGSNVEATPELGEPREWGEHSVWFKWRPLADGQVTLPQIPGCEGNPDTSPQNWLEVYTGTHLADQTLIVSGCWDDQTFMADAAKTYMIALDSRRRGWGSFNYVLTQELSCLGKTVTIGGTRGPDRLRGTPGPDVIASFGGGDSVRAGRGRDLVCGGAGNDTVRGGVGEDKLVGGKGRDRLFGALGEDRLVGGPGPDKLFGGKGRDGCKGGKGDDTAFACE